MEGGTDYEEERTIDTVGKYLSCFPVGRSIARPGDQIDAGRSECGNGVGTGARVKAVGEEG